MIVAEPETLIEDDASVKADAFVEVNYDDLIPNNVDLSSDRQLLRALETWQPEYISWWKDMGPDGFQATDVYLRTAVGVDPAGWAKFGHVKMPDYRWGILLAPEVEGKKSSGVTRVHKGLAFIHFPAMIIAPILGSMAYKQKQKGEDVHGAASHHASVAAIGAGAYFLSMAIMVFNF